MPASLLAFNASLRHAAARPRSAVRRVVAALAFLVVATPVSAALCAASMAAPLLPAIHVSHQHDDDGAAALSIAGQGSDVECCDTQTAVDWTVVSRSSDGDSIDVELQLLVLAGPPAFVREAQPRSREPRHPLAQAGVPPPESVLRRLPRLLL